MKITKLLFIALFTSVASLFAYEHPFVEFTVHGVVQDWATKAPLADVQILVFLNDLNYGDNPGHIDIHDYPNFPRSEQTGKFQGRARFPGTDIKQVEIIAFCKGYRTERFIFGKAEFKLKELGNLSYSIEIPHIPLLKTTK